MNPFIVYCHHPEYNDLGGLMRLYVLDAEWTSRVRIQNECAHDFSVLFNSNPDLVERASRNHITKEWQHGVDVLKRDHLWHMAVATRAQLWREYRDNLLIRVRIYSPSRIACAHLPVLEAAELNIRSFIETTHETFLNGLRTTHCLQHYFNECELSHLKNADWISRSCIFNEWNLWFDKLFVSFHSELKEVRARTAMSPAPAKANRKRTRARRKATPAHAAACAALSEFDDMWKKIIDAL